MDEIDLFLTELNALAKDCPDGNFPGITVLEALRKSDEPGFRRLLNAQHRFLTSKDKDRASPFLIVGWFDNFAAADRIALIALATELDERFGRTELDLRMAPYVPTLT
jgi:hypothetical protein